MADNNYCDANILWNSFLDGDDKAFVDIYNLYIQPLLSYGKKLTSDHELVQDSVQGIFIDLYQKRVKKHFPIRNLKAYLFIALKNSILQKILQNRIYNDKVADNYQLNEFNIEYSFQDQMINLEISKEKHLRLQNAIVKLPSKQKEIIYLKFEEELEYTVIARLMKITVESARKQLYRALLSLRQILDNQTFLILLSILRKKNEIDVHV
jgi:RNA polymerase sigma factor (sigma-70 family)